MESLDQLSKYKETYLGHIWWSLFAKIVGDYKPLTIFSKNRLQKESCHSLFSQKILSNKSLKYASAFHKRTNPVRKWPKLKSYKMFIWHLRCYMNVLWEQTSIYIYYRYQIFHQLNCKSSYIIYFYIIYLLECLKCQLQYVGKSETEFS